MLYQYLSELNKFIEKFGEVKETTRTGDNTYIYAIPVFIRAKQIH